MSNKYELSNNDDLAEMLRLKSLVSTSTEQTSEEPTTINTCSTDASLTSDPLSKQLTNEYDAKREHDQTSTADTEVADVGSKDFKVLEHTDCMELLDMYDEGVQKGETILYKWQVEIGTLLSSKGNTTAKPLRVAICANNGAGKDSFIIAPFAVWFILTKIKARVIITSSSGTQLTGQTEPYIVNLCKKINTFWNRNIFSIKQRHIECLESGSEIRMFATDEAGKAEGWHPIEPNREFAIMGNEMKSVDEEIAKALRRCTGYSHYILISSPGSPKGAFYNACTNWEHSYRITSEMCKHIPESERIEDARDFGEHSSYYRSKHKALFTSSTDGSLITEDMLNKCKAVCTTHLNINWPKRIGLDYSKGGDECVLSCWIGNKRHVQYTWRERDTVESSIYIDRLLRDLGLPKDHSHIVADDGGIGAGITDQLVRMGWTNIRRVHNQSPAHNKKAHGNIGAEMWASFKRIMELGFWLLPYEDERFIKQLISRHVKDTEGANNRLFLLPKKAERAQGYLSPDRADAAMLANIDVTPEMFLDSKEVPVPHKPLVLDFNEFVKQQVSEAQERDLNRIMPSRHEGYVNEHLLNTLGMPIKTYKEETNLESTKLIHGSISAALDEA